MYEFIAFNDNQQWYLGKIQILANIESSYWYIHLPLNITEPITNSTSYLFCSASHFFRTCNFSEYVIFMLSFEYRSSSIHIKSSTAWLAQIIELLMPQMRKNQRNKAQQLKNCGYLPAFVSPVFLAWHKIMSIVVQFAGNVFCPHSSKYITIFTYDQRKGTYRATRRTCNASMDSCKNGSGSSNSINILNT